MPDLDTFVILPWEPAEERTARLICSVRTVDGDPFIGDPRNVLIKMLKSAEEMGYSFKTGVELEFFLFRSDAEQRAAAASALRRSQLFRHLRRFLAGNSPQDDPDAGGARHPRRFGAQRDRQRAAGNRLRLSSGADLRRSRADGAGRAARRLRSRTACTAPSCRARRSTCRGRGCTRIRACTTWKATRTCSPTASTSTACRRRRAFSSPGSCITPAP